VQPQFLRAIFAILIVRAIFISPAQGSEFGPAHRAGDSSLKRLEAIRPTRLRFTKPLSPSASQERIDCLDGGDDDDERISLAAETADARFWVISARLPLPARRPITSMSRSLVRLRC
jgi:hypothetical protein